MTKQRIETLEKAIKVLKRMFPAKYNCKDFDSRCLQCQVWLAIATMGELLDTDNYMKKYLKFYD